MTSIPAHARVPVGRRRVAAADLLVIRRASVLIDELGVELDRQLATEQRPSERLRMLREATNRITRTANDAIHAYGRARRAVNAVIERDGASRADALEMRDELRAARKELLAALRVASRRYPAMGRPPPD